MSLILWLAVGVMVADAIVLAIYVGRAWKQYSRAVLCIYAIKFCHSYSYFVTMAVAIQFLSQNLRFNDIQASYVFTAIGLVASILGTPIGMIIDELSVFSGIMMGVGVAAFTRIALLAFIPSDGQALSMALAAVTLATLFPCGDIFIVQSTRIAIKRYIEVPPHHHQQQQQQQQQLLHSHAKRGPRHAKRTNEYSLGISIENGAALFAFGTVTLMQELLSDQMHTNVLGLAASLPALGGAAVAAIVGWFSDTYDINAKVALRQELVANEEEDRLARLSEDRERGKPASRCARAMERVRPSWFSLYFFTGAMGEIFARFLVVSIMLIGIKTVFRQIDAMLPKYTQRAFDPAFPYAALMMINPAMIVVLSPLVQPFLERFETQRIFIAGTAIGAAATLMAIVPMVWALGIFCVLFTIGEITWTTRYEDWVWEIAPENQEGAFGSVAVLPVFLGKMGAGVVSGYLLDRYCPSTGTLCSSYGVWGSLAAIGAVSPLGILVLYRWIKRGDTPLHERPQRMITLETLYTASPSSSTSPRNGEHSDPEVAGGAAADVILEAAGVDTPPDYRKGRRQRPSSANGRTEGETVALIVASDGLIDEVAAAKAGGPPRMPSKGAKQH